MKTAKSTKSHAKAAKAAKVETAPVQLPAELPAKAMSSAAAAYHARKDAGTCVKCGQPLDPASKLLCTAHLTYYNNWHAAKRAKIAEAMALLNAQAPAKAAPVVAPQVASAKAVRQPKLTDSNGELTQQGMKMAKRQALTALKATVPTKPAKKVRRSK